VAIRTADFTEPHLFAHGSGDLFWWVSHGMDEGAMPRFDDVLSPNQRWNVINFIHSCDAGALAARVGPEEPSAARAVRAASADPESAAAVGGAADPLRRQLRIIAIGLSPAPGANSEDGPPLIVWGLTRGARDAGAVQFG
jgi:hypothetical protein